MSALTLGALLAFVLVHLFVGKVRFPAGAPRSCWLSAAGGVAVAYVFTHILPDLGSHQRGLESRLGGDAAAIEAEIYMVALAGLALFYGVERGVRIHGPDANKGSGGRPSFWLHICAFALYNVLIGYLLVHREQRGLVSLLAYATAMAVHFLATDYGMRDACTEAYERGGRWVLAGAVTAGWAIGLYVEISELGVALLFAFLSGGIILNVLKEELPEERKSRFLPFLLGAVGFSAVLQAAS